MTVCLHPFPFKGLGFCASTVLRHHDGVICRNSYECLSISDSLDGSPRRVEITFVQTERNVQSVGNKEER